MRAVTVLLQAAELLVMATVTDDRRRPSRPPAGVEAAEPIQHRMLVRVAGRGDRVLIADR